MSFAKQKTIPPSKAAIRPNRYLQLFEKLSPLIGTHDPGKITEASCDLIAQLLEVEACSILLADPAAECLRLRGATHIPRAEWPSIRLPLDRGICGEVYASGRTLLLRTNSDFAARGMEPQSRYGRASCVVVPIRIGEARIIGVINIANPRKSRAFNVRDVAMIEAASRMIAGGLESALLLDQSVQTHRRLERIFENIQAGVAALDPRLTITHHNIRFSELVGKPGEDFSGRELAEAVVSPLYNVMHRLIRQTCNQAEAAQERYASGEDGKSVMFEITVSHLHQSEINEGAHLIMIEDIGQEEEVKRLKEADSLKRAFMRMISHELRTPLTVLQGAVPIIQSCCNSPTPASPERLAVVERLIRPNVQRLTGVVNAILDVVDIENGKLELAVEAVNLNKLIEERVAQLKDMADRKKLRWEMDLMPGLPPVEGDLQRLRQVFFGLIENAVKFANPETAIRIRSGRKDNRAIVWIIDRGELIPPEKRGELFEKFHQLDIETTRKAGGCGLGLFLARSIARLHDGDICIEDGDLGETVFRIELPLDLGTAS